MKGNMIYFVNEFLVENNTVREFLNKSGCLLDEKTIFTAGIPFDAVDWDNPIPAE